MPDAIYQKPEQLLPPPVYLAADRDHPALRSVVALWAFDENGFAFGIGTAFFIAPGLLITAKHVVQEVQKSFRKPSAWSDGYYRPIRSNLPGYEASEIPFRLCFGIGNPGDGSQPYYEDVLTWYQAEYTDIAFLRTGQDLIADNLATPALPCTLFVPAPGAMIHTIGFPIVDAVFESDNNLKITDNPFWSSGVVGQVYDMRRDAVLAPWPCFTTNAELPSGMSGAPVWNEAGEVCGVVSRGWMHENDGHHPEDGLVAMLWPSLLTSVATSMIGKTPEERHPVRALAELGLLRMDGWQNVFPSPNSRPGPAWVGRVGTQNN